MSRSRLSLLVGMALAITLAMLAPGMPASAAGSASASPPFAFAIEDVSYGMQSQRFTTGLGTVCTDIEVHTVRNPGAAFGSFKIRLYEDGPRNDWIMGYFDVLTDGVTRTYCFDGLSAGPEYYFFPGFGLVGGSGSVWEYVDGYASVWSPAL